MSRLGGELRFEYTFIWYYVECTFIWYYVEYTFITTLNIRCCGGEAVQTTPAWTVHLAPGSPRPRPSLYVYLADLVPSSVVG
jgi:hypothetical protein